VSSSSSARRCFGFGVEVEAARILLASASIAEYAGFSSGQLPACLWGDAACERHDGKMGGHGVGARGCLQIAYVQDDCIVRKRRSGIFSRRQHALSVLRDHFCATWWLGSRDRLRRREWRPLRLLRRSYAPRHPRRYLRTQGANRRGVSLALERESVEWDSPRQHSATLKYFRTNKKP
jgi:hypothetical protein